MRTTPEAAEWSGPLLSAADGVVILGGPWGIDYTP